LLRKLDFQGVPDLPTNDEIAGVLGISIPEPEIDAPPPETPEEHLEYGRVVNIADEKQPAKIEERKRAEPPSFRPITLGVDPVECPKCGGAAIPGPDGAALKCMVCDYGWPPKTTKGKPN
jgi:hypothetical protein